MYPYGSSVAPSSHTGRSALGSKPSAEPLEQGCAEKDSSHWTPRGCLSLASGQRLATICSLYYISSFSPYFRIYLVPQISFKSDSLSFFLYHFFPGSFHFLKKKKKLTMPITGKTEKSVIPKGNKTRSSVTSSGPTKLNPYTFWRRSEPQQDHIRLYSRA